jgi:heat shock protein HslJ
MTHCILSRHTSILCIIATWFVIATGCATAPELLEDTWEIATVGNQRIDTTMSLPKRPMFRFFEESKVQGFTGCNMFFGTFTQREDTVQFSPMMTSKMACTDRENVILEERVLSAFRNTFRARRSGQTLEFLDIRDTVLMTCVGIPNEEQPMPAQELPR